MNIRYPYDYYKYIIIVNRNISKEWFLDKAGVRRGYAKDLFSRLYDSIFAESTDVIKMYKKYYKQEYDSWQEMLYKKYNLSHENIQDIENILKSNHDLTIIDYDAMSYGEYTDDFLFSEDLNDRIYKLLMMSI